MTIPRRNYLRQYQVDFIYKFKLQGVFSFLIKNIKYLGTTEPPETPNLGKKLFVFKQVNQMGISTI